MTIPYADFSAPVQVRAERTFYETAGKRFFDIAFVILSLPVVLPPLLLIAALTWIEGGRPFYVQERIGHGGRTFRFWKIRTMVPDADAALARLIATDPAAAAEWTANQKLARDPRITRLGRFLRQTSLDELPQIWNVLNGTMSLVGPRPFTPDQRTLYPADSASAYYRLRPGLSGLWQISRRNAGSFVERVHYDEDYGLRVSLMLDLKIIWRTFSVMMRATGL
ncbi:sugar transferase [Frigidibacter sp. RF13]|uniref:sugar transferase n=1 Tax=Frigidibacter sp. RF13 TaxID=2997340 RepID=UPI00226EEAD4|nr:sugar transferase [Frigidibacter sp. RF13]MCY1126425.1 sugar transferase [Frigidibacter sp. RF13]